PEVDGADDAAFHREIGCMEDVAARGLLMERTPRDRSGHAQRESTRLGACIAPIDAPAPSLNPSGAAVSGPNVHPPLVLDRPDLYGRSFRGTPSIFGPKVLHDGRCPSDP